MTADNNKPMVSKPTSRPRRLGSRSAHNRYLELKGERELTAHDDARLRMAAKLYTHAVNLSNALFFTTELREDGEPRVALKELRELHVLVRDDFSAIFDNENPGDDLLRRLRGE